MRKQITCFSSLAAFLIMLASNSFGQEMRSERSASTGIDMQLKGPMGTQHSGGSCGQTVVNCVNHRTAPRLVGRQGGQGGMQPRHP